MDKIYYEPCAYREPTVEEIKFNKEFYGQVISAAPEIYKGIAMDVEILADIVNYRFTGHIWGRDATRQVAEYPATWWQFFKRDHMPKWFTKRYPVKLHPVYIRLTQALEEDMFPDLGRPTAYLFRATV